MRTTIVAAIAAAVLLGLWLVPGPDGTGPRIPPTQRPSANGTTSAAPAPAAQVPREMAPATFRARDPAPADVSARVTLPAITFMGTMNIPGERAAITVLVDGNSWTLREGDRFGDGFAIESLQADRLVIRHDSGARFEKRFDELTPTEVASARPVQHAPQGYFPETKTAPPAAPPAQGFIPPGAVTATMGNLSVTQGPTPGSAATLRQPGGGTVADNPLVGAMLPGPGGEPPPGVERPRPLPQGGSIPQGPKPRPIAPDTALPTGR